MFGATVSTPLPLLLEVPLRLYTVRAKVSTATVMFGATVRTPLPLLLEVPLRLRLGLRLVPRYRYCLEFRALRLGSLLGLGLPATAKARPRAIYIIAYNRVPYLIMSC